MASSIRTLKLPFHYGKLLLLALQCKVLLVAALLRNRRARYILTLPHKPSPQAALYKLAHRLGYIITRNQKRAADLVIFWQDRAVRDECDAIEALAQSRSIINYRCRDLRKQHVAKVFEETFGYRLQVKGREHQGPMIKKSDGNNGCHDAVIIIGPVAEEERGFVYQKVVNNIMNNCVRDVRVPFFAGQIPYCVDKSIPIAHRFRNTTGLAVIRDIRELVNSDELRTIRKFCDAFGLDYGEFDLLRDYDDGRLYIVDVNNCPYGPLDKHIDVKWYFDRTAWDGLERMAKAFTAAFTSTTKQGLS